MKASLKELAGRAGASELVPAAPPKAERSNGGVPYRTAQTRIETRQISGHFKPEVAQTLSGASAKLLRHLARQRPRSGARCGAAVYGPRRRDACARSSTRWRAGRLLRSRARPRSGAL